MTIASPIELLDDCASKNRISFRFLPNDRESHTVSQLAQEALRISSSLSIDYSDFDTIAVIFSSSFECLAFVLGAWGGRE